MHTRHRTLLPNADVLPTALCLAIMRRRCVCSCSSRKGEALPHAETRQRRRSVSHDGIAIAGCMSITATPQFRRRRFGGGALRSSLIHRNGSQQRRGSCRTNRYQRTRDFLSRRSTTHDAGFRKISCGRIVPVHRRWLRCGARQRLGDETELAHGRQEVVVVMVGAGKFHERETFDRGKARPMAGQGRGDA